MNGREIKFRCWFPAQDGLPAQMMQHNDLCLDVLCLDGGAGQGETLMQYTGLKDKNGVEIFEGDVVFNDWENIQGEQLGNNWVVAFGRHETSNDCYSDDAYGWFANAIGGSEKMSSIINIPDSLEVIGNLYEHPHLLEAGD